MRAARAILFLLAFTLLYFSLRIPVYPERMQGEDGSHAGIFLLQPKVPGYLLVGRLNGKDIFGDVIHPAATFEILKAIGPLTGLSYSWKTLTPYWLTTFSRAACSLYLLATLLLFATVLFRIPGLPRSTLIPALLILTVIGNSSFAIFTSANLQLDNTAGVLLTGLLSAALLAGLFLPYGKAQLATLFLAAATYGLGKNEWNIILWLTILFLAAWLWVLPGTIEGGGEQRPRWLTLLGVIFAGSIAGNLANYLLSPSAYVGGLELMLTGGAAAGGSWAEKIGRWLEFTKARLPSLLVHLGCFFLSALSLLLVRRPVKFHVAFLLVLALGLFSLYIVSLALPMPRYFAPAFVASLATLLAVRLCAWSPKASVPLYLFLAAMAVLTARIAWRSFELTIRHGFHDEYTTAPGMLGCVPLLDAAAELQGTDFVFAGMTRESAAEFLRKNGVESPVCP